MKWNKVTIETNDVGLAALPFLLEKNGVYGCVVIDPFEVADLLENPNKTWDYEAETVYDQLEEKPQIIFYIEADDINKLAATTEAIQAFHKQRDMVFQMEVTGAQDSDWADKWKENYKPMSVGNFTIVPAWEDYTEASDEKVIYLNPGHVFGTGQHESTQLVLEILEGMSLEGQDVADIGCGSGILSIGALLLGAKKAYMTEIEANAASIIHENMALNNLHAYQVFPSDILTDIQLQEVLKEGNIDVFLINIVADVIIKMLPLVAQIIQPTGQVIVSGILDIRKEEVLQVLKRYFTDIDIREENNWVAMRAKNLIGG